IAKLDGDRALMTKTEGEGLASNAIDRRVVELRDERDGGGGAIGRKQARGQQSHGAARGRVRVRDRIRASGCDDVGLRADEHGISTWSARVRGLSTRFRGTPRPVLILRPRPTVDIPEGR